jgi:7-carboxy-7-deazaguanine synthase
MKKVLKGLNRYPKTKEANETFLLVNEIYKSINGEGPLQGYPVVIVRLMGCNLRCSYCDTKYAYYEGERISFNELLKKISSFKTKSVLLTGGEPLCQSSVIDFGGLLIKKGYEVSLETNGSYPLGEIPKKIVKIVDVKTPDSGFKDSFIERNLLYLDNKDCLKFVLSSEKDYKWAKDFLCKRKNIKCEIIFSPVYNKLPLKKLAEWIIKDNLYVKMSFQLHKAIWGERRGV